MSYTLIELYTALAACNSASGRAWHMRLSPGRGKQDIAHVHPQGS